MSEEHAITPGEAANSVGILQVNVPLTPAYSSQHLTLEKTTATISIPLLPGEQRTTTPEQVVGAVPNAANPNLIGTLTVWSDYDPVKKILTFASSDLVSPDAPRLSTYLQGAREQLSVESAPELTELFEETARAANEAIVEAAIARGFTVIVRTPPPEVTPEEAAKLRMVYRNGVFQEVFDPDKEYGEETKVFNIESTWYGEIILKSTDYYANVIGSTGDPKVAGLSWLQLWQNQFGAANWCSSYNFNGFVCGTYLVGGHSILGTTAHSEPVGSNNVFIMPICAGHNANNGVYMAPVKYNRGCALHNYMQ
ncbi:MAG TPA: hypothetical protein VFT79_11415 [Solirubrobacterales bacterium]|nr:hypothetical protein [Solirubrobacterales bacterium]